MCRSILMLIPFLLLSPQESRAQYLGGQIEYAHQSGYSYELEAALYLPSELDPPDSVVLGSKKTEIADSSLFCDSLQQYSYRVTSTFPSAGTYHVSIRDSSFSRPFINTPGTDSAYVLGSELAISPFSAENNNMVNFHDKPLKKVHPNDTLVYHPAFTNPDGDSLAFELVEQDTAPAYTIPSGITVNPKSGELRWPVPDTNGRYTFTMEVSEYEAGGLLKGRTQRQFTIDVRDSISEQASFQEISGFQTNPQGYSEVHISPGQSLNLVLQFEAPQADSVHLEAVSELFSLTPSPYFFSSTSGTAVDASFSWTPDSSHVRDHPYVLSFIGGSRPNCTDRYKAVLVYVDETSSLKGVSDQQGAIELFPNPASSELNLQLPEDLKTPSLQILNREGRIVKALTLQEERRRIDVRDLAAGLYFVRIQGEEREWKGRFIRE